jgi:benzoyl-CoA reductase/2-hydroxyglutaryl-CoA dehydratase subunit BcrC/BadD/HgdB
MEPQMIERESGRRRMRLRQRINERMVSECDDQLAAIRLRNDFMPELEPFLEVLKQSLFPAGFFKTHGRPFIMSLCIQAPMELFHAAGAPVYKLACGSFAARNLAPLHLPALTCPMIKSIAGVLQSDGGLDPKQLKFVVPTTCDWVVKFSELVGIRDTSDIHFMELPHLREDEGASRRFLKEMQQLKQWLEMTTRKPIRAKMLLQSIQCHAKAWALFCRLIDLKRAQMVPAIHFAVIANALPYQDIDRWIAHAHGYIHALAPAEKRDPPVFLTGSPIVFPNYKLFNLIENAGMAVAADDICSLERAFAGGVTYEDPSEYALLNALAQRSHKACICPTFADNRKRISAILNVLKKEKIKGIIFHVLKGCHPYDMESGLLEVRLKELGFRFLKIETDYVREDEQNIVTRLEAFRRTLI